MRIGYDISQTGLARTGTGHFAESLLQAMSSQAVGCEWLLYTNFGEDFWDPDHARATTRIPGAQVLNFSATHAEAIAFWGKPGPDFEKRLGSPEIVHANNYYCPERLENSRLVYTLYDLGFFEHPEFATEANRLVCAKGVFHAALHADLVLAISDYTRSHFLEFFPHYPDEKVRVVYPASRFLLQHGTGERYRRLQPGTFWLAVGTIEPRKNWRLLLDVYAELRRSGWTDRKLVLAGGSGWLEEGFERYVRDLGVAEDVICAGYIADHHLRWLYNNCFAFVYPSLFEGFGMPVLEAMSMGAAVITSAASSLPEVIGEAGLLIDPVDPAGLVQAMLRLERDPVFLMQCRERSLARSIIFSWERSAAQVLGYYENLVKR